MIFAVNGADTTSDRSPAIAAVQAIRRLADSGQLVQVVGENQVEEFLHQVARTEIALSVMLPEVSPSLDVQQQQEQILKRRVVHQQHVNALYELARQCLSLVGAASAVDENTLRAELGHMSPDRENVDLEWVFGLAVAEVAAHGLGAVAIGLKFSAESLSLDGWAMDVLERLSLDFDYFAAFMFGGLSRLDSQNRVLSPNEKRLFQALCVSCIWALWAVGQSIGYHNFTGKVLWEWASEDAIWAITLAKGVVSISLEDLADVQLRGTDRNDALIVPADLQQLQDAVLGALLGLAHPQVVFSMNYESNDVPISARNADLARHKADLAASCVRCKLFDQLLRYCADRYPAAGAALCTYVVALLQPELTEDLIEADMLCSFSFEASQIVEFARKSTRELIAYLSEYTERFWQLLVSAALALGRCAPSGFLEDCANFAHFLPPPHHGLNSFIDLYLTIEADTATLAALCILSANANVAPHGGEVGYASERLAHELMSVPAENRAQILERWARWRGPVRLAILGQWAGMLQSADILNSNQPQLQKIPLTCAQPQQPKAGGLRNLIDDAPADFCCAYDGQLMLDPVISPQGIVFERMVIANALTSNGGGAGYCPITREPLTLQDCQRLPELRMRITKWVRERASANKKYPRLSTVVQAGSI